jgi:hypothetical protein
MKAYYAAWKSWAEGEVFNSTVAYDPMSTAGNDASIWHHAVMTDGSFSLSTLENWANLIDQAIVALDPNDPNYVPTYPTPEDELEGLGGLPNWWGEPETPNEPEEPVMDDPTGGLGDTPLDWWSEIGF